MIFKLNNVSSFSIIFLILSLSSVSTAPVTGGKDYLGRLGGRRGHSSTSNEAISAETNPSEADSPSIKGYLGKIKDAVPSDLRVGLQQPKLSRKKSLGGKNEGESTECDPDDGDEEDEEEMSHDEHVAKYLKMAEEAPDAITAAKYRTMAYILAPRRSLRSCPSYVRRLPENVGAHARKDPDDYPSWFKEVAGKYTSFYRDD